MLPLRFKKAKYLRVSIMHIHFNKCSNWWLKCGLFVFLMIGVLTPVIGQTDSIPADSIMEAINEMPEELMDEEEESVGFYKAIKTKFIEGKCEVWHRQKLQMPCSWHRQVQEQ